MSWARALVASLIVLSTAPAAHAATPYWVSAGLMGYDRTDAAAVAIAGGESALVIGGVHWTGTAHDAQLVERYDKTANRWTTLGRLPEPRGSSAAALLPDGRVLVAGGWNYPDGEVASADLYEPATDTWSDAKPMHSRRGSFGLVVLDDGKALAVGGSWSSAVPEVYDPAKDTWTATVGDGRTGPLPAVAKLRDGRVLAAGGRDLYTARAEAQLYDPRTNTWTPAADMHLAREQGAAATLPDGRVLVAGGYDRDSGTLAAARTFEIYEPATDTWTAPGPLNRPRAYGARLVTLSDGRLVITGGHSAETEFGVTEYSAEIFDPATGAWTQTRPAGWARSSHVAVALADDSVLVAGGLFGPRNAERLVFPKPTPEPTVSPEPTPMPTVEATVTPSPAPRSDPKPPPGVASITVPKRLKASKGGAVSLRVRCTGGTVCAERVILRVRGARTLARADVRLVPGTAKTVKLKLTVKDRRRLSKRSVKVTVVLGKTQRDATLTL